MDKGMVDEKLFKEISDYCELNELKTEEFINEILKEGFMKKKWGAHQPNQPTPKKEVPPPPPPPPPRMIREGEKPEPPPPPKQRREIHIPKKRDLYGE
jgi:hypothetical protein